MDIEPAESSATASSSGEKMDHRTAVEVQEKDEDVCALFATSMPRDVWANPSLAALAAMIDEDEEEKEKQVDGQEHKSSNDHEAAPQNGGSSNSNSNDDGNEDDLVPPLQGSHSTSTNQRGAGGGSSATSGARHQRREDTRRRRNERRASPYGPAAGRRGQGELKSSGRSGVRDRDRGESAPTTGETQVLMSLWGL